MIEKPNKSAAANAGRRCRSTARFTSLGPAWLSLSLGAYAVRLFLATLSAAMLAGCSQAPTLSTRIQSAGGEAALKRECQSILDEHQKTQKEFWMPKDSVLPRTIAALQPQVVHATRIGEFPMVDIQVSGGFSHHGLMVVLTNTPLDFLPGKGNWRVTRIGDGVYEYRE